MGYSDKSKLHAFIPLTVQPKRLAWRAELEKFLAGREGSNPKEYRYKNNSFIIDDFDFPPGQVESPSQISQGTVSVASETEDTLAGVPALRRSAPVVRTAPLPAEPAPRSWPKTLVAVGIVAALAGVAVWAAWWLGLFR